jgi:hypothetical protein
MAKPPIKSLDDMKKEFMESIPEEMQAKFSEMEDLRKENYALKKTLEEYGIEGYSPISEIEYICIKGIDDLKKLANTLGLTEADTKMLDTLHKNLRMARGKMDKKELPDKTESVEDLLSIINGGKK